MRFLADESCDAAVVRALRAAGHDVLAVYEDKPGLTDEEVIARAVSERRLLLTEDKDFGQLTFSAGAASMGCIFLRFPAGVRGSIGQVVVRLAEGLGEQMHGAFVTVEPGRTRITRLPL